MRKAREYTSSIVDEILSQTDEKKAGKISNRMRLSAKIADAMKTKGWNNNKLLEKMERKSPSVISKWLSGTHNFTIDTLSELEVVLEINLLNLEEKKLKTVQIFHFEVSQIVTTAPNRDNIRTINNAIDLSLFSNGFENLNEYQA